jgi:amidase
LNIARIIPANATTSSLNADMPPIASIRPGLTVRIETTDLAYRSISGKDLDSGAVDFRALNQLTGPIAIEGALPGDALGFTILEIELGPIAHVPYISRWRYPTFPRKRSSLQSYPIRDGSVHLSDKLRLEARPMVGCVATAPAHGSLSSLSPAERTGGNLDIEHLCRRATIWLPVETPGALFAIGDIHASMGSNEPVGAGLECAGMITGFFDVARGVQISGPRIESATGIHFIGSHPENEAAARQIAVRAAWSWLSNDCGLEEEEALAVCAAALNVTLGGPAGLNYVASFDITRLRAGGISAPLLIERHQLPASEKPSYRNNEEIELEMEKGEESP